MQTNKLVSYSIIFIGLALAAVVLQTFVQVLRPLAIAVLLMFLAMPLAKWSKAKGIPVWSTFVGLIVVVGVHVRLIADLPRIGRLSGPQSRLDRLVSTPGP